MKKEWRYIDWESCQFCGGGLEVLTDVDMKKGYNCDGDAVRCTDPDSSCNFTSQIDVYENNEGDSRLSVQWQAETP